MPGEERRASIVSAAVRLFAARGFRGATTRELAAAVGVSEPVLYQHFRTKRELYDAIIQAKSREGQKRVMSRLEPLLNTCDDRAFFRLLAGIILDQYAKDPEYMRLLLFSALEGHELAELFYEREVVGFYRCFIDRYISRRMREKAFRDADPAVVARGFVGLVAHHGLVRLLFHDRIVKLSRKRLIDELVDIFLKGISNHGEGVH
jgi:AcrR family transcriptional regulator